MVSLFPVNSSRPSWIQLNFRSRAMPTKSWPSWAWNSWAEMLGTGVRPALRDQVTWRIYGESMENLQMVDEQMAFVYG